MSPLGILSLLVACGSGESGPSATTMTPHPNGTAGASVDCRGAPMTATGACANVQGAGGRGAMGTGGRSTVSTGGRTSTGNGGATSDGGVKDGGSSGGTENGAGGSSSGNSAGGATPAGGMPAGGNGTGATSAGGTGPGMGGKAAGGTANGGTASGGTASGGTASGGAITNGGQCSGKGEYSWPPYSPNVAYDSNDEYGGFAKPTKDSNDVSGIVGRYTDNWWTFVYGANKNPLVTSAAWVPMLQQFNKDFAYITDVMRWPRDARARAGYYSAIYLFGSGLSTDTASNTATGGWQSSAGDGPMVLASYYPVYSFDPACTYSDKVFQQGAMIHEGIHSILSTMPGCRKSCWFNEAGNVWLQANLEVRRSGKPATSMGFLSAGAAVAPFMPIECYSGWLQDGSFGGPCAENVEKKNSAGQKISTWRTLLGGTQYGENFANALGVILGDKAMAWVFRYTTKSGRLLQDLAEVTSPSPGIGPAQTRRLIQEYRARQVFGDFGVWSGAYKNLLNDNWNVTIDEERVEMGILKDVDPWMATPYVKTTRSGNTLTPDPLTLPGWSGANQIPLTINAGASCVTVNFKPTGANMSCQLVYRDTSGKIHYGAPVSSGTCSVPVSNVKDRVVVAVLSNTDYIFDGGLTKYGYTLDIGEGVSGTANINTQWYK